MEPIISPWFFYLIDVLPDIGGLLVLIAILLLFLFFVLCVINTDEGDNFPVQYAKKKLPSFIVAWVAIPVIISLIPSKETMIQMAVASQVTPDNIETVMEIGKSLKDEVKGDVIDVIEKLKEE